MCIPCWLFPIGLTKQGIGIGNLLARSLAKRIRHRLVLTGARHFPSVMCRLDEGRSRGPFGLLRNRR